ncbi:DNA topoisomerase 3-alpha [Cardamine amara subsp. amara]|uniref:DNA topoisomerase 3-alpha n=1 Tax=Cardamine amara subsp. amara TaxID=228776 RepID=A0ABD0Z2N0_CARAN
MQTGNCFRCRQAGHWISDCPLKSKIDVPPPAIHCHCGGGLCEIKVSNTKENPGRKFYKCPAVQTCKFFKWCDKVIDEDIRFRPAFIIPICPCGAGPCRRFKDNSGRAYLQCCIKKGFGACRFFQWEDVQMIQSCDAIDEIDFWVEAEQILSDVESSFKASGLLENANQVALPEKFFEASVCTEDDSIFENLDVISVSDTHSAATAVNQGTSGIPVFDSIVIEPQELWKTPRDGDLSKLSVDEVMSDLVRDTLSSGSVVLHGTTSHERPGTGEFELSFPDLQDLIEKYNAEKLNLERVSGKHVQVLSAYMGSYRRLRSLHEKTCHLRQSLLETEKEMACCEAETLEFGVSCREVAVEMAESQKRMQEIAEKLGKEVEVLKQTEFVATKRIRT